MMEIVAMGNRDEESEETRDHIIVFPYLKRLNLEQLPTLGTLCSSRSKLNARDEDFTQAQALFNHKVALPALEELKIEALPNKQIWDDSAREVENSFYNLQDLSVWHCGNLVNVIPSSMRPRLHQLKKLVIGNCDSVVSIVKEGIFPSTQVGAPIELVLGLTILIVERCLILKNVVSSSIATKLVHLQKIEISDCEGIEEVVAMEKAGAEYQAAKNHLIVFSALKKLRLNKVPNFSTFCRSRSQKEYAKDEKPLFNRQVAFPALEELIISRLPNKQIWDNSAGEVDNSFSNLRVLRVWCCGNLVNVIPSSMRSRLHQLKKLLIFGCNSVVSVVEEGIFPLAQAGAAIELVVLGLSELNLVNLKSLISTGLENLEYRGAPSNLTILKVKRCPTLKNVVSSSIAPELAHLQELKISDCEGIEVVVAMEKAGEEYQDAKNNLIVFSALKILHLKKLPNFRTFCRSRSKTENAKDEEPLFNHEVAFPALEELKLESFSNTEIWDKSVKMENSFGNLTDIHVLSCDKLVNVIPTHMTSKLRWLQILTVKSCESVVCIVEGIDNVEEGKECKLTETINLLPALIVVELENLKSLTCLFGWEMVGYSGGQVVPTAFRNLRRLSIKRCPSLRNVVSSSVATNLVQLEELFVSDCEEMMEIVTMVNEAEVVVFPLLNTLRVERLPSLVTFATTPDPNQKMGKVKTRKEDAKLTQPLFDQKVSLPELKRCFVSGVNSNVIFGGCLPLHSFDKLTELRIVSCDNLSTVVLADLLPRLQSLKVVEIEGCDTLRNLFSPSVVAAFVQLQLLKVCSCKGMEEIVSNEEKERVMIGEIALTGLEDIVLEDLPNLKSFCSGNYAFKLPSLRKLVLSGCRNIQNFISGKVSMPKKDVIDGNGNQLIDLNEYARQQATEASQLW